MCLRVLVVPYNTQGLQSCNMRYPYAPVLATVKLDDPDSQESGLLAEMPKVHVTFLMQLLEDCGNVKSGKVLLHPGRFNVDSRAG